MKKKLVILSFFIVFWVVLPVILLVLSHILAAMASFFNFNFSLPLYPGIIICTISGPLLLLSVWQFWKFSGELPVSAYPPVGIIRRGLYNYWRHPIYLFYSITLIGIAFLLRSASMLFLVMPVFLTLTTIYIIFEERGLRRKFGAAYEYYSSVTGIVVPVTYQVLRLPLILAFKLLFRYKVKNRNHFPLTGPYIIVSYHKNYLDPFFIACAIDHPVSFLTTFEVYRSGLLRWLMKKSFSIPRRRYIKDAASVIRMNDSLRHGGVIGLFPEGERSWTGENQTFKPEVLKFLAKTRGVPIVPVKIVNSYEAWPRWAENFRRHRITVEILRPFIPDNEINPEKLGKILTERMSAVDDEEVKSSQVKDELAGLEKVIYRCPDCRTFNSIEVCGAKLICKRCGLEISSPGNLALMITGNRTSGSYSISKCYDLIKITPSDRFVEQLIESKKLAGIPGSGQCSLYSLEDHSVEKILDCELLFDKEAICFFGTDKQLRIEYSKLGSVTTESNYKLQLYCTDGGKLYQAEFRNSGVLLWQDLILSITNRITGRTINSR